MSQDCVLIVTGFGSFPGVARNSTAEIVDELRSSINIEGFIKGKVIQVSAVAVLQSLINLHRTIENLTLKGQKVVLLHLGVDSNEKGFRLERRGWNGLN